MWQFDAGIKFDNGRHFDQIRWYFEADIYHDQTFAEDLSSYLINASWSSGFDLSNEYVAPPARLTATLDNRSGVFYPEIGGSELITNGDFASWSAGAPVGWSVTGTSAGVREVTETAPDKGYGGGGNGACNIYNSSSTPISLSQTILTSGETYRVKIRVTRATTGNITVTRAPVIIAQGGGSGAGGIQILELEPAGAIRITAGTRQAGVILSKFGEYTFYVRANGTALKIESVTINNQCNITFDNVSVQKVAKVANLLTPGTLVRMRANAIVLWTGAITAEAGIPFGVRRKSGFISDQSVTLIAEDYMLKLLDSEFIPRLETNVKTGTVLQGIFDSGVLLEPYPASFFRRDVQGSSELDTPNCRLWNPAGIADFESGNTELPFAGDVADSTGDGVSAQGYIRDLVAAEAGGRFYWDARSGKFRFTGRDAYVYRGTVAQTFTQNDLIDAVYLYGDTLNTQYTINYTDRKVGAAASVLWKAQNIPIRLRAGEERAFVARYNTNDNARARVGGQDFIVPVSGLDYSATQNADGSGDDMTAFVEMLVQFGATAASVRFINDANRDVYVQLAQIRGTPLIAYPAMYSVISPDSASAYGILPRTENLYMLSNEDFVQQYAAWNLSKHSSLRGRFSSITYKANKPNTNEGIASTLKIGDFVRVTDSTLQHDGYYAIIGERHSIEASTREWLVTYSLLQTNEELFMLLDVSSTNQLDVTARLGL